MTNTNIQKAKPESSQPEKVVERIVYVDRPVLVELTDKKYKRWMVIGTNFAVLGFILGIVFAGIAVKYDQMGQALFFSIVAVALFCIGVFIKKTAEYMAWWNNG